MLKHIADYYTRFSFWQKLQLFYIVFELFNSCVYYQFKIIPNIIIIESFALITFICFVGYYQKHTDELKNPRFACVLLLLFLLITAIAFRFSTYTDYKYGKAIKTLLIQFIWLILLFFCPKAKTKSEADCSTLFKNFAFQIVILFTLCVSLSSLLLWIIVIPLNFDISAYTSLDVVQDGRLCALYFNSDLAGITSLISMLLAVNLLSQKQTEFLKINRISIIIQLCVLFLSGCRSAILPFSLIITFLIIKYLRKKYTTINVRKLLIVLCACALFLQVILTILRMPNYEFSGKSLEVILNKLTASRYSLWKEAIILSMSSPIWGNGLYTMVALAKSNLVSTSVIIERNYDLCHNLYISALYSTGITGLICVIILTKSIVDQFNIRRCYMNSNIFLSEMFIAFSLFIYSLFNPAILFVTDFPAPVFWLLIGYIIAQNNYHLKRN